VNRGEISPQIPFGPDLDDVRAGRPMEHRDRPLRLVSARSAAGTAVRPYRYRVSAEAACEIVHKASPRKRRPAAPWRAQVSELIASNRLRAWSARAGSSPAGASASGGPAAAGASTSTPPGNRPRQHPRRQTQCRSRRGAQPVATRPGDAPETPKSCRPYRAKLFSLLLQRPRRSRPFIPYDRVPCQRTG
jgi:hypothetical protein